MMEFQLFSLELDSLSSSDSSLGKLSEVKVLILSSLLFGSKYA